MLDYLDRKIAAATPEASKCESIPTRMPAKRFHICMSMLGLGCPICLHFMYIETRTESTKILHLLDPAETSFFAKALSIRSSRFSAKRLRGIYESNHRKRWKVEKRRLVL